MQAQGPTLSHLNLAMLQQPNEGFELEENRDTKFDISNSLTGDAEQDQILLGIITTLVQLIMRHFDGEQQPNGGGNSNTNNDSDQQSASNGNSAGADISNQFSNRDKGLLLNAIGTDPATGTTINSINDSNSSGHLNSGDNLQLQQSNIAQTRTLTGAEVGNFIDARNPPGTPTLPLNPQQSSALENRFGLENISISDTNGDQKIGLNDILTGTQNQGSTTARVDIPLDQEALNLIGNNNSSGGGNGLLSGNNSGIQNNSGNLLGQTGTNSSGSNGLPSGNGGGNGLLSGGGFNNQVSQNNQPGQGSGSDTVNNSANEFGLNGLDRLTTTSGQGGNTNSANEFGLNGLDRLTNTSGQGDNTNTSSNSTTDFGLNGLDFLTNLSA